MTTVSAIPRAAIPNSLSSLVSDWQWGSFGQPLTITYSFPTSPFDYRAIPFDRPENFEANFRAYADNEKDLVRDALRRWSDVALISFTELTGPDAGTATIRFAKVESFTPLFRDAPTEIGGIATIPSPRTQNGGPGQVWVAADLVARNDRGTLHTTVHEIGHALIGLLDISIEDPDGPNDNSFRSVMHYFEPSDLVFPGTTPMPADMEIARRMHLASPSGAANFQAAPPHAIRFSFPLRNRQRIAPRLTAISRCCWPMRFRVSRCRRTARSFEGAQPPRFRPGCCSGLISLSGSHSIRLIAVPSGSRKVISRCLIHSPTRSGTGGQTMVPP